MATPIGHALAGYAVSRLAGGPAPQSTSTTEPVSLPARLGRAVFGQWRIAVLCVFMALAPDLDLIPGFLQGKPILYHGGISHSLGAALIVSVSVAWLCSRGEWSFRWVLVLGFIAYASHLLLDPLGPDGRAPYGIPILWPLSDVRFLFPWPLLPGVHHAGSADATLTEFMQGVLSRHNVIAILLEMLLLTPWILLGLRRIDSQSTIGDA